MSVLSFRNTLKLHTNGTSVDLIRAIPNHESVIVTASRKDSTLKLWEIQSRETSPTLSKKGQLSCGAKGQIGGVTSVCSTYCGEKLVVGYSDGSIRLWNWQTLECSRVLKGHSDAILSLDVSNDSTLIISSSKDNTMRLWDFNGGCLKKVNQNQRGAHTDLVTGVSFLQNLTTV